MITFASTSVVDKGDDFVVMGDLSIKGVTKPVELDLVFNGTGPDPWGGTLKVDHSTRCWKPIHGDIAGQAQRVDSAGERRNRIDRDGSWEATGDRQERGSARRNPPQDPHRW